MYLSEIKIKNFRKFGEGANGAPGLILQLNDGLNVLIGENDSGKTCVIDAIRFVLLTQSREYIRLEKEDFHKTSCDLRIECTFRGFTINQAKDFLEWLAIDDEKQYFLRVFLTAKKDGKERVTIDDIRAGADDEGQIINSKARDLLRTIYLKPLRDAENELAARKNSRLSQILYSHPSFEKGDEHEIVEIIKKANKEIKEYFDYHGKSEGDQYVLKSINTYLSNFSDANNLLKSGIEITASKLKAILEKIDLVLSHTKPGLGSLNQLYIATELLLLQNEKSEGVNLALIEEIEAHLHPQAQLRVIEYLQEICNDKKTGLQVLLTTHSVTLASIIKLENLTIFTGGKAFSLKKGNTKLHDGDYQFLERFLDSTKANLFFAKGVLIVEGDAENLLLPALAEVIGKKLSKYGVSIVNVRSTALLRYGKIFIMKNESKMSLPVAIITDCDEKVFKKKNAEEYLVERVKIMVEETQSTRDAKKIKYSDDNVRGFISPQWTLEFDVACSCLKEELYAAILMAQDYKKNDDNLSKDKEPASIKEAEEYMVDAKAEISGWPASDAFEEAKNICENVVLKKSVSKAIVAQCFANILLKQKYTDEKIIEIRNDQYLKYLVDAIDYVTGG